MASDPHNRCFEDLLADPHEQFDRRGELLASIAEYAVAPPSAASAPPKVASRPSSHKPGTKSYAIDQVTDVEHLRAVAHRMWEAFFATHSQAAHSIAVLMDYESCTACMEAIAGDGGTGCPQWQDWQRAVTAGFGSV